VNVFSVSVGIGAALGLFRISRQRSGQWLDAALFVLMGALVGARAAFILVNPALYAGRPLEMLEIWRGGLAAPGAFAGGALALALAAALYKAPLLRMADWLYPLMPPVAIGAWLGCWLLGAAYGTELPESTWWAVQALDESGAYAARVPVQLVAAVALGVFYWLMETLTPLPRPSGWLFSLAATWLVLVSLAATLLRADPTPIWKEMRMDTWAYLILLVPFYGMFSWLNFLAHKNPKGQVSPV
jgi:prolipoprotein diacylglyceryltransferase